MNPRRCPCEEAPALDLARAWRLGNTLELQGRLGAFHAQGTRLDASYLYDSNSTTSGATLGIGSRLYPLAVRRMRIFIEGSVEILYTPGSSDSQLAARESTRSCAPEV